MKISQFTALNLKNPLPFYRVIDIREHTLLIRTHLIAPNNTVNKATSCEDCYSTLSHRNGWSCKIDRYIQTVKRI